MKEWLTFMTENVVVIINAMALVIIAIGTIEAFLRRNRCHRAIEANSFAPLRI
jgi:hypothetical protein